MRHIQHLDELTYSSGGRKLLHKLLTSIRERDQSQNVKIVSSRKFDGAPAIIFGREANGKFFLTTKAFFNAIPIICYSEQDIWEKFEDKPDLLSILVYVWKHLHDNTIPAGGVYQADLMFYGKSEFGEDTENYMFQPNLIRYSIPHAEAKHVGLCVHTKLIVLFPGSTDNNVKYANIPSDFTPDMVSSDVFLVQCDSSVFQSADLKGVAVHDELASKMDVLLEDIQFSDKHLELMQMFDNALVRGEFEVTDKRGYLANFMQFVTARMAKELLQYKTDNAIYRCSKAYTDVLNAHHHHQIHSIKLYEFRKELAEFKHSLATHLDKYSPTNVKVEDGFEHEGFVVYLNDLIAVKIVDRDEFSRKNFNKNGNNFNRK